MGGCNPSEFRKRVLKRLVDFGWQQKDLCAKTGLTYKQVNSYITGRVVPDAEALDAIARALGVSADYLLGRTEDMFQIVPEAEVEVEKDLAGDIQFIRRAYKELSPAERDILKTLAEKMLAAAREQRAKKGKPENE